MGNSVMDDREFIDILKDEPQWVIVMCNLLAGLKAKLYSESFVKKAIGDWRESYLRYLSAGEPNPVAAAIHDMADYNRMHVTVETDANISCTHSLPAIRASQLTTDPEDRSSLAANTKLGTGHPSSPRFTATQLVKISKGRVIGDPKRPERPVFLASFRDIEPLLKNEDKADQIRDKLGLVNWKEGTEYVMLKFQGEQLASLQHGRPTFADAGSHRRFKATASAKENQKKRDWGFALDLKAFAQRNNSPDGGRERICNQIRGESLAPEVQLHPLGFVAKARGDTIDDNDDAYAAFLRDGRSVGDIASSVKAIL